MNRINNDSSDSVTPPPPKLTPVKTVKKRGRPPGSPNKQKSLKLPHLHNVLKQKGKGVGRPRGVGRGKALKRGVGRGVVSSRGTSKTAGLLKNLGRGMTRSPAKKLTARGGRGALRGRTSSSPLLTKIKIKGRPPGRPRKINPLGHHSSESNTQKSIISPTKDIKSMKFFSHLKSDKSSSDMDNDNWDRMGSLQGVSILEHEPDSMDEDFEDDFYNNGESDNVFERPVDLRNYWSPPSNVKSLMDKVCITDVTTDSGTITFRECPSNTGFFKKENGESNWCSWRQGVLQIQWKEFVIVLCCIVLIKGCPQVFVSYLKNVLVVTWMSTTYKRRCYVLWWYNTGPCTTMSDSWLYFSLVVMHARKWQCLILRCIT